MLHYTNMGLGTVDLNIHINYIPPSFELFVGLKENEKKIKPSEQCI